MGFRDRGPVTRKNSIFIGDYVFCPFSTNKWTDDEYFLIHSSHFSLVESRSFSVQSSGRWLGHLYVSTWRKSTDANPTNTLHRNIRLHALLYGTTVYPKNLVVDHRAHWTDQINVDFVPQKKNVSRGQAQGQSADQLLYNLKPEYRKFAHVNQNKSGLPADRSSTIPINKRNSRSDRPLDRVS